MNEEIKFNKVGDNHEKRIFKIEVGQIAPEDVDEYVKKIQESFKKPIPLDFKLPEKSDMMIETNTKIKDGYTIYSFIANKTTKFYTQGTIVYDTRTPSNPNLFMGPINGGGNIADSYVKLLNSEDWDVYQYKNNETNQITIN